MRSRLDGADELVHEINVTPLIDVVLVLLVVLMVTCAALASRVIAVEPAGLDGSGTTVTLLTVAIDGDGSLYLDGVPTRWEALGDAARAHARAHEETRVVISASREARHEAFVRAVDTLRAAGIERYSLAVPSD